MAQAEISAEWLLEGFKYELETTLKPKTVEYYYGHARRFLLWARAVGISHDIRLIDKRRIHSFFQYLLEETGTGIGCNGSRRRIQRTERSRWPYYVSLRRFFSWAVEEHYLEHNPMSGITLTRPMPPPIEPYRAEHIAQMFKVLDHDWQIAKTPRQRMLAARDRAVLCLFLESLVRSDELSKLTLADIDLKTKRVLVRAGKGGKARVVGFGPETKKALWRYIGLRPPEVEGDALWVTEEGRPMKPEGVRQTIRRLKKDAGLQHVKGSVHKLRHTGATVTLRHTRDMKGLRLLLGHSTLAMTERYTQFIEAEDALSAYDGQGPLDWLKG